MLDETIYIPLAFTPSASFWWPWIKNYYAEINIEDQQLDPVIARVWIDQALKAKMGYQLLSIFVSIRLPQVILTEAALSFLGYGIPPPFPSWGGMLSGSGRNYMFQAPWMAIWPGMALAIVVYGVNMFGDAVRDLLDPRLRGGVGSYGVSNIFNSREKSE